MFIIQQYARDREDLSPDYVLAMAWAWWDDGVESSFNLYLYGA